MVVANKVDMNPKAATKAFAFTEKYNLPRVRFCSAADGTNVVQTFEEIVAMAYERKFGSRISNDASSIAAGVAADSSTITSPSADTYVDDILDALEYFEGKEQTKDSEKETAVEVKDDTGR